MSEIVTKPKRSMPWKDRRPLAMRHCRGCSVEFQPSCGGHFFCGSCRIERRRNSHSAAMSTWRKSNRTHARRVKANWDLKRFNLTIEQYESMVAVQDGRCAICGIAPEGGRGVLRKLAVDHCHRTHRVRGLLCSHCNTAIGLFREKKSVLLAALQYLETHSEVEDV